MPSEWISARDALAQVATHMGEYSAARAICSRAFDGLVRAKAHRICFRDIHENDRDIPREFWWAKGGAALEQNWISGDFESRFIKHDSSLDVRFRAYGVLFAREDINAIAQPLQTSESVPATSKGGRPPAEWWDDLWIEIARQLYSGELIPKTQSDIVNAMQEWLAMNEHSASDSTLKSRARKLFLALEGDDKNSSQ